MRILIWGINYAPEVTGIGPFNASMAEWLVSQGHEVEMVTAFPYYPEWRKQPDDRSRLYRTDRVDGVHVHRCWHYVPRKVTALKRMFHEASFIVTSLLRVLTLKRADVLVAISPPLPLGFPVWLVSRLWRRPYLFHVQDMQPDAAVGLGMLKPGMFTRLLYALERFAYCKAAAVSGISDGMLTAFREKGVGDRRRVYFPNWVPDELPGAAGCAEAVAAKVSFCRRHGLPLDSFLLVYSGNVGVKQGLGVLLEAARRKGANPARLSWVIAGDGAGKEALVEQSRTEGVESVHFLPLQSEEGFAEMLVAADVAVITQQKGSGQFFFPSKLLTVLGRAKPVLAVADETSELARAVVAGRFGLVAPPGDPDAVMRAANEMAHASTGRMASWAASGLAWVSRFGRRVVLAEFEETLARLAQSSKVAGVERRPAESAPAWLKAQHAK